MRIAGADPRIIGAAYKTREARLSGIRDMQNVIAWWAQAQAARGRNEREMDKLFYLTFGTDRYTAMTLSSADAMALSDRVILAIGAMTV
jgi:hypothetical protein